MEIATAGLVISADEELDLLGSEAQAKGLGKVEELISREAPISFGPVLVLVEITRYLA